MRVEMFNRGDMSSIEAVFDVRSEAIEVRLAVPGIQCNERAAAAAPRSPSARTTWQGLASFVPVPRRRF